MRASEALSRAQFRKHSPDVLDRTAHPFQFGVLEAPLDKRRAHLMVAEQGAVIALGGFIQLYGVVLDGGGLDLFGNTLLHVPCSLTDLEEPTVRTVVDRVGVDARPNSRLRRKDFLDGTLT